MYYLLILAVGIERLVELVLSKRNARLAFANGGKEFGRGHHPGQRWNTLVIVVPDTPLVHTAWLTASCFTVANALLLTVCIRIENVVLGYAGTGHR